MGTFLPGLSLSRALYDDSVRPVLDDRFPGLPHAAALLGRGSEVLGYDDEMSTDHDWQPRVLLFVGETDEHLVRAVAETVQRELPPAFRGREPGVEVHTVRGYFLDELALDVDREISVEDWLTLPEQALLTCTAGDVFHDDVGLREVRERLAWYPHDLWLYLLVTGWWRVHPEANLVGRAGFVGDELGSSLIGSRLVTDLMRLCFLMERRYPPYPKWFGTAFSRLACGARLEPVLRSVGRAETWQEREAALDAAYREVAAVHDGLGLTEPVTLEVERMWDRPFGVAWADVPGLLAVQIEDPAVLRIAERWPVGPVDQFRHLPWPARNRPLLLGVLDQG